MALLDSVSISSNFTVLKEWANGKYGEIVPTKQNTYVFVECYSAPDGQLIKKNYEVGEEEPSILAYGFVTFWLRFRKRKEILTTLFSTAPEGKTPKEIFDLYIEARKSWFIEYMRNRPDAWKYPDLETLFYEQNLTVSSEENLINASEPLLDYLDEEDKQEFAEVVVNFLDYVASIVEPYQHVMEDAARQKLTEQNTKQLSALDTDNDEEMNKKWPHPERIRDNKVYSIDSPEIIEIANSLDELQLKILDQLLVSKNYIEDWQENAILNSYTQKEIWDASCKLYEMSLIDACFEYGCVSAIRIMDKGKLVLRGTKSNKIVIIQPTFMQYKDCVESVFLPTYRLYDSDVDTYPQVIRAFKLCIDPKRPSLIPIFLQACIDMRCARVSAPKDTLTVIKALEGLGLLKFDNGGELQYSNKVNKKENRTKKTTYNQFEETLYNSIVDQLRRT